MVKRGSNFAHGLGEGINKQALPVVGVPLLAHERALLGNISDHRVKLFRLYILPDRLLERHYPTVWRCLGKSGAPIPSL